MKAERRTVAIVAPSGPPALAELEQSILLLRSWGYEVLEGPNLRATWRYMAGTTAQRTDDLIWALEDPRIDVVWFARGGFGIQHCLPLLANITIDSRLVIGCSDSTALLQWLHLRGHKRLMHGPMIDSLAAGIDDASRERMHAVLTHGVSGEIAVTPLVVHETVCRGPLLGGNLTMLASLCGTASQLRARGAIVMLEDVTEHAFRLDRCILQLRNSGALDGACAFVLGQFTRCYLPQGADYSAAELVAELLRPLGAPIAIGAAFGHGSANFAWPYGLEARLDADSLRF